MNVQNGGCAEAIHIWTDGAIGGFNRIFGISGNQNNRARFAMGQVPGFIIRGCSLVGIGLNILARSGTRASALVDN